MSLEEHPEIRKLSPSHYPEIDWGERWRTEFRELMDKESASQTSIIKKIAKDHNVSYPTVYIQIFPRYRLVRKNNSSSRWQTKKNNPVFPRSNFNEERALKEKVRYHIDKYIQLTFLMTGYQTIDLPKLSDFIYEMTEVRFRPSSFLTLSNNYFKKHGKPLLEQYQCHALPQYGLNKPKP